MIVAWKRGGEDKERAQDKLYTDHRTLNGAMYSVLTRAAQLKRIYTVYVLECWPNTTSAWARWRIFDIPVDRYDGVHSLLQCSWGLLPATRLDSRKILIEQNIKSRTGPALCVFSLLEYNSDESKNACSLYYGPNKSEHHFSGTL